MTIGDMCNLLWRSTKRKRKLKSITLSDVPYSEAMKASQELAKECIELGKNLMRLEYNGYRNYQTKLRLNIDFE